MQNFKSNNQGDTDNVSNSSTRFKPEVDKFMEEGFSNLKIDNYVYSISWENEDVLDEIEMTHNLELSENNTKKDNLKLKDRLFDLYKKFVRQNVLCGYGRYDAFTFSDDEFWGASSDDKGGVKDD